MEERKGDARIYVISFMFFACIVTGGSLLFLYIFVPQTDSASWYPIVGMILVGIPWAFWLFTYLYRCIKPSTDAQLNEQDSSRAPTPPLGGATNTENSWSLESPINSPCSGGQRRVHFGAVVVLGNEDNSAHDTGRDVSESNRATELQGVTDEAKKLPVNGSGESEMPLTMSVPC
ncbi:hypothetical protein I3843_02G037200 [Carya illinoinensis]|uniref:Uncharacterized protein n=1 Tax=Carya illinoinensis TaxID=32201 RepID=A0A922FUG4_CARIL|nr:hypothetical protein I3842_02G047300 [Carya illinoinensis]KAG7990687.1 hypothetical protein I3843_02G037200 [Carya illinoinensis]